MPIPVDDEFLRLAEKHGRKSFDDLPDRDFAMGLMPHINFADQLSAIKEMIDALNREEALQEARITALKEALDKGSGGNFARLHEDYAFECNRSVYADAARSIAVSSLLASFLESALASIFRTVGEKLDADKSTPDHPRFRNGADGSRLHRWNCQKFFDGGRSKSDLVRGVQQLAEVTGFPLPMAHVPAFKALFEYRNYMLHNGMEWGEEARAEFSRLITEWPSEWFSVATSDGQPWVYYMTKPLMVSCLAFSDEVIDAAGRYFRGNH
jgi:hypothetical protein